MTDQVRISDDGQLEIERTWDGEPLWSAETQQDELFAGDAFQQMPGQLAIVATSMQTAGRLAEAGWTRIGADYRGFLMESPEAYGDHPANQGAHNAITTKHATIKTVSIASRSASEDFS